MKKIKIIVCAKQIPDPEAPLSDVSVDPESREIIVDAPLVINPFDENALESAIQIKEKTDAEITVLSLGKKVSDTVMRKVLAAGADELIILQDDRFEKLDSHSTACALADAIHKIGEFDLILTGRQAGDWDSGQVGLILGELLKLPCINMARSIRIADGNIEVSKSIPQGYEQVKAKMPALVTVSNEVGELRYISRMKMMKMLRGAASIPLWSGDDFNLSGDKLAKMGIVELLSPADMSRDCELIKGSNIEEQAEKLAKIFKELQ